MIDKEKIIETIEHVFKPLKTKHISFGNPYNIYTTVRPSGSVIDIFSEENKVTVFPIIIETIYGALEINLRSTDLANIKHAIGIAFSYSSFLSNFKIPDEHLIEIQKRIYLI